MKKNQRNSKNPIQQNVTRENTFQKATGKIDYTLTNDYMFRAVMQKNEKVLRGLICSLLRLDEKNIKSVNILNPIELGEYYGDKDFVLDVKVMLNNEKIVNNPAASNGASKLHAVNSGVFDPRGIRQMQTIFGKTVSKLPFFLSRLRLAHCSWE